MSPQQQIRSKLTQAQEDYLKALYHLGGGTRPVSTAALAERLQVAPPSATEMLHKLATLDLVVHERYHGARLSVDGEAIAVEVVRHHRLLEMYLTKALGYGWDEVHEEAEKLEHHISERLEQRIYDALGRPDVDPHGDPIPSIDGEVVEPRYRPLTECDPGQSALVRRVSDRDPQMLREIDRLGLHIGAEVVVVAGSRFEGPISVRIAGRRRQIPLGVAKAVYLG